MDRNEVINLTHEYGGDWGIKHAERLLHLVSIVGEGMDYNQDAIWAAAYLHDWGGYGKWAVPGVEHFDRSAEVATNFMEERSYPEDFKNLVLEIIVNHHGGNPDRSLESIIFTDADALDMLGAVGTLKVFSIVPRNFQGAVTAVKKYRDTSIKAITFDKTRQMAEKRIKETDEILRLFEEETFGMY